MAPRVRILGPGRAGGSFAGALTEAGWSVDLADRDRSPAGAAAGVDLVLVCVPDRAVPDVAAAVDPVVGTVVAHCSGSLGLDVLATHRRRASVHPLVSLPSARVGALRLRGAWFGVAGDPLVHQVVAAVDGRPVEVPDDRRATYHAAAVVASNHLVALLGQVERIAATAGVPLEAYLDLARGSLDNVARLGPVAALTGPVARGDWDTVDRHLEALPADERAAYRALAEEAARLAGRPPPTWEPGRPDVR
jgi:predicted short-subunit dehydrogenase-like oxidoreductase (DUF2520 family)